jgi:hypothetical protein
MILEYIIGILALLFAFPFGMLLAKFTKDELYSGKRYFQTIIILCFIGLAMSLTFRVVEMAFTFVFIGILTSMCLRKKYLV